MKILIPLHNEVLNENLSKSNTNIITITTHEVKNEYNDTFYAEIGKFLYAVKHKLINDEIIGFMQNRRFFVNLDECERLVKHENTIIVSKLEGSWISLENQFRCCHPEIFEIFKKILTNDEYKIFKNVNGGEFHNIFISPSAFFYDYGFYLNEKLLKFYDECLSFNMIDKKYAALAAERLLIIFRKLYNIKSTSMDIITISKK